MPAPRTTIDDLPEQTVIEDGNYFIIQDDGVTKKMSMATLRTSTSVALEDHLADTTGAHEASSISTTPISAEVDGVTVQGQLSQLAALVADLDARVTALEP
ncbi:MAG TPA: hypothetical protein VFX15_00220 [Actinomycetes bacterium]|nr:hypothetical protein [Actinomycetes bacterium]